MKFKAEITDMYGGEANYSWVTRHDVEAKSFRGAVCKMSRESGLSWRKHADLGDTIQYLSESKATTMFITQELP